MVSHGIVLFEKKYSWPSNLFEALLEHTRNRSICLRKSLGTMKIYSLNNALVHRGMSNKILKYFFSHKNRLLYYNAKFVNSKNFIHSQRYNDVCFLVREMKYKYFVQRLWRLNRRRNERGDCRFTLLVNDRNRVKNAVLLSDWINEREWTLCAVCRSQKATSPVMFSCIFRLHLRPELILSAIMRKSSLHDGRHTFFSLFVT